MREKLICLSYFDIVKRFYEKLKSTNAGVPYRPEHMKDDICLDDIYAFFIFCHQFKEWIKHDNKIGAKVKDKVEDYINSHACLRYCADIANGIKHLDIKPALQRSKTRPRFTRSTRSIIVKNKKDTIVKDLVFIETENGEKEVFRLASECINSWAVFIEENLH